MDYENFMIGVFSEFVVVIWVISCVIVFKKVIVCLKSLDLLLFVVKVSDFVSKDFGDFKMVLIVK